MRALRITPTPKPRMTRRDKWLNPPRPGVRAYREFKDQLRTEMKRAGITNLAPMGALIVEFVLPMPKSWSKKKKAAMLGQPHAQTPDLDNLVKALLDAAMLDDKHVHTLDARKTWGNEGCIYVKAKPAMMAAAA